MKVLRFRSYLVPLVLSGEKDSTWRLFDDKDLSVGDSIELQEFVTNRVFAHAKVTGVVEKKFSELTEQDKLGHESYINDEEMYAEYSKYYKVKVVPSTTLKIIWFDLSKRA